MPFSKHILLALSPLLSSGHLHAEEVDMDAKFTLETHGERAKKLAYDQDDLSADVQDLIDEQTDTKIIDILRQTEIIMADATDLLEDRDTGGATIATQTEIIEKIFEAAKQKQQSSGQGEESKKGMSSMLQMMENMMSGGSDKAEESKDGEGENGEGAGGGGGASGGGGAGSGDQAGKLDNTAENTERRVPKSSGNTGTPLPKEFQKAMDAYNKAAATQP